MTKLNLFTDEQLAKLRKYLEDNAQNLANDNRISKSPYYPNKERLSDYQWLIVNCEGLGKIEMYFTGISSLLKIKGIYVETDKVESFNFRQIHDILERAFNQKLISDSEGFFNNL